MAPWEFAEWFDVLRAYHHGEMASAAGGDISIGESPVEASEYSLAADDL
jgi:hypothetical protein